MPTKSPDNPPIKQFLGLVVLVGLLMFGAQTYGDKKMNDTPTPTATNASPQNTATTQVAIATDKGDIVLELFPADAPKTVQNFVELSKRGYYNGLTFHRVEAGFVIQGGDPKGDGTGGESIYGETFEDELNPGTESYKQGYKKGVLAMANRGPNTNGSQFFIMLEDTELPKNYTIFGRVTSGMDVVEKITAGDVMKTVTVKE